MTPSAIPQAQATLNRMSSREVAELTEKMHVNVKPVVTQKGLQWLQKKYKQVA